MTVLVIDRLDRSDSEREFRYQRKSFDAIVADVAALLAWRRPLARLARPLVRRYMSSLSPYWARDQADAARG